MRRQVLESGTCRRGRENPSKDISDNNKDEGVIAMIRGGASSSTRAADFWRPGFPDPDDEGRGKASGKGKDNQKCKGGKKGKGGRGGKGGKKGKGGKRGEEYIKAGARRLCERPEKGGHALTPCPHSDMQMRWWAAMS